MISETIGMFEFRTRSVSNNFGCVAAADRDAEKPSVERHVVRDDPELVVPMVDRVLDSLDPWKDGDRFCLRVGCRHVASVTRDGGLRHDEDEPPAARPLHGQVVAVVILLDHEDVTRRLCTETVSPDLPWTHGGVGHGVEVVKRVGCPCRTV